MVWRHSKILQCCGPIKSNTSDPYPATEVLVFALNLPWLRILMYFGEIRGILLVIFQKSIMQKEENFLLIWSYVETNCGKFLKRWEYQTTWPASWEICMQVKKQKLELDMEQQTGSKSGKEYIKAVYCHPAYLTYMQSTSCEMLGCKKSWNQDCWEKYQ